LSSEPSDASSPEPEPEESDTSLSPATMDPCTAMPFFGSLSLLHRRAHTRHEGAARQQPREQRCAHTSAATSSCDTYAGRFA
jgi:hypothetical protein